MPFFPPQERGRMYAHGRTLKKSTIGLLTEYNSNFLLKGEKNDKKFIEILLKEFFGRREIITNELDENVVSLIEGIIVFIVSPKY